MEHYTAGKRNRGGHETKPLACYTIRMFFQKTFLQYVYDKYINSFFRKRIHSKKESKYINLRCSVGDSIR